MRRAAALAVAALAATASTAAAQAIRPPVPDPPPPSEPQGYRMPVPRALPPAPERSVSVTISPLHLLFPVLEVTTELKVGARLGLAAIGGVGAITATGGGADVRLFASELGASVRYYLTGSFGGGVQVGAEALYLYLQVDDSAPDAQVTGAGAGLSLGPFVGYKFIARGGFTFDGQGGLAYVAVHAHASDGTSSSSSSDNRLYPLLNVNIGWSF